MLGMQSYESQFLFSLLLTIAIETAVLFALVRHFFKIGRKKLPSSLLLFAGIIASSATLPYVWFVLPAFAASHSAFVFAAEFFAIAAESAAYFFILKIDFNKALAISFACNAASFLLGVALL